MPVMIKTTGVAGATKLRYFNSVKALSLSNLIVSATAIPKNGFLPSHRQIRHDGSSDVESEPVQRTTQRCVRSDRLGLAKNISRAVYSSCTQTATRPTEIVRKHTQVTHTNNIDRGATKIRMQRR